MHMHASACVCMHMGDLVGLTEDFDAFVVCMCACVSVCTCVCISG